MQLDWIGTAVNQGLIKKNIPNTLLDFHPLICGLEREFGFGDLEEKDQIGLRNFYTGGDGQGSTKPLRRRRAK